ncbi:aromatase [Streptomyces misionensis]|uniref:Aromatase n=1 Tax=Streptomyces misionensis TaxID=67331 RepID=A0A1H4IAG6_9ACTN|nr:aromatase/cyclase [Streptomyces misionensis]SEB30963.1 aromatase [Streptomyces misionensis]
MSKPEDQVVERSVVVDAPAHDVFDLVTDVTRWPQLLTAVAHVERTERCDDADEVRIWAVRGTDRVATWTSYRTLNRAARTISFRNDPPAGPAVESGGTWEVTERPEGDSVLTVRHHFRPAESADPAEVEAFAAGVAEHSGAQLKELAHAAEHRAELEQLIISFEDPLFIAGSVEDAYELLHRAEEWPDRFPHVTGIDVTEPEPGIQFFDMDTVTPDGRAHTTRSVRVCMPGKIVYKQIRLAPLLTAHTGHWLFTPTPEGVIAGARHTATINPANLHLLAPGATVQDARRYLRKVLSANSVSNLRFAKEYAEERAERAAREPGRA